MIDQVAKLLISFMDIPNCDCNCNCPCQLSICQITGNLFWACALQKCYYLDFSQERPAANEFDVGQLAPMGR